MYCHIFVMFFCSKLTDHVNMIYANKISLTFAWIEKGLYTKLGMELGNFSNSDFSTENR